MSSGSFKINVTYKLFAYESYIYIYIYIYIYDCTSEKPKSPIQAILEFEK